MQQHFKRSGLAPKTFSTLKDILEESKSSVCNKSKQGKFSRRLFFCIGTSQVFKGKDSIHVILKKARNKYNLKWLRLGMSYHKFSNLGQILQGDLTGKQMDGITSKDFEPIECNCHNSAKWDNGVCAYNGECRSSVVVYKAQ